MEGDNEDVRTHIERDSEYKYDPPEPFFKANELSLWSFYRAGIAEFVATLLFLYISVLTVMGVASSPSKCSTVGVQGIAWAFGGMIFVLVYCTAGISGNCLTSCLDNPQVRGDMRIL